MSKNEWINRHREDGSLAGGLAATGLADTACPDELHYRVCVDEWTSPLTSSLPWRSQLDGYGFLLPRLFPHRLLRVNTLEAWVAEEFQSDIAPSRTCTTKLLLHMWNNLWAPVCKTQALGDVCDNLRVKINWRKQWVSRVTCDWPQTHTFSPVCIHRHTPTFTAGYTQTHICMHTYTGSKVRGSFCLLEVKSYTSQFFGKFPCKTQLKGVVFLLVYLYSTCVNERKRTV